MRLSELGRPKLLSLEHEVKYFDLEEGAFAEFSAADHTRMQAQAKARIEQRLPQSGVVPDRGDQILDLHVTPPF